MAIGKPIIVNQDLIRKIRALRQYGLTLRAIAARLGLAESTVHKISHRD